MIGRMKMSFLMQKIHFMRIAAKMDFFKDLNLIWFAFIVSLGKILVKSSSHFF